MHCTLSLQGTCQSTIHSRSDLVNVVAGRAPCRCLCITTHSGTHVYPLSPSHRAQGWILCFLRARYQGNKKQIQRRYSNQGEKFMSIIGTHVDRFTRQGRIAAVSHVWSSFDAVPDLYCTEVRGEHYPMPDSGTPSLR